ncbi:hypothetical protein DAPPUDRAFT_96197, partial [Daphnia pulex]
MSSKPKKKVSSSEDTSSSSSSDSSSSSSSSGSDSSSSDSESSQASAPKQCNKKKVNRTRVSSTNSSSDSAPKKETVKKEEPKKKQNNAPTKAKPPQPSKKPAAAAVPAKAVKKPPAKNSTPVKKQPQPSSSATVSEASNKSPKLQQKMRSIFSPENSSMSSDSDVPTNPKKSAVLQSSEASDTDTESGNQVNQPKSKGPRARVQPRPAARKSSESEAETKTKGKQPARKLTRSSSARIRKSKHVIGKVSDSDSEGTEVPVSNKSSSATGKRKPAAAKGKSSSIGNRKLTPKEISSYSGSAPSSHESCNTPSVEEKKCPMAGCDSTGHLNGKTDRHLSLQACPSYHNLTMSECAALRLNAESQINHWSAISTNRQDFHVRTPRSPRSSGPTSEQLKEQQKVRQARAQKSERKEIDTSAPAELDENAEDKWREREPNLTGLTSEYDLALFRASQAEASTKY